MAGTPISMKGKTVAFHLQAVRTLERRETPPPSLQREMLIVSHLVAVARAIENGTTG